MALATSHVSHLVASTVRNGLSGGGRIAFPPALGEPGLVADVLDMLPSAPVELLQPYRTRHAPLPQPPNLTIRAGFGGGNVDPATYAPLRYGRMLSAIQPGGPLAVDVALLRLSPADAAGQHRVGPSATVTRVLARAARLVIAEIDPDLPHTAGPGATVPSSWIDVQVPAAEPLELPPAGSNAVPVGAALGQHVASLVPDGAVLQVGMGRNAQAIVDALRTKTALRLHAGLLSEELRTLLDSGSVDRSRPVVVGEAVGPRSLMEFIDGNDELQFETSDVVHNPALLSRHDTFVTVNSVLAIDLLGRASTEHAGGRVVGGLGGLIDFLEAGCLSRHGHNILILPTDRRTSRTRLVRRLPTEHVSVPTYYVDFVVTECGVADLRATTPGERAERLLAVADPQTRQGLLDQLRAEL